MKKYFFAIILLLAYSDKSYSQSFFGPFTDTDDKFKDFYKSYFKAGEKILKTWYHYTVSFNEKEQRYILRLFHPEKGMIFSEVSYLDKKLSKKDGVSVTFNQDNGNITIGTFVKGKEEGRWRLLDTTGFVLATNFYVNGLKQGAYTEYYNKSQLKEKSFYVDGELNGLYKSYLKNGNLKIECTYDLGKVEGDYKTYDSLGVLSQIIKYEKGEKVKTINFKEGKEVSVFTPDENEIYIVIEKMAYFKGNCSGLSEEAFSSCNTSAMYKYVGTNLKYPLIAAKFNVSGRIFVNFVIEKDGSISNVKLLTTLCQSLDDETLRMFKTMPKWEPGIQNGKPVRVHYNMPIVFKLE